MSDQSVLLPKWFTHVRITLAKGQLGHSFTFLTMFIMIFCLVSNSSNHPLVISKVFEWICFGSILDNYCVSYSPRPSTFQRPCRRLAGRHKNQLDILNTKVLFVSSIIICYSINTTTVLDTLSVSSHKNVVTVSKTHWHEKN